MALEIGGSAPSTTSTSAIKDKLKEAIQKTKTQKSLPPTTSTSASVSATPKLQIKGTTFSTKATPKKVESKPKTTEIKATAEGIRKPPSTLTNVTETVKNWLTPPSTTTKAVTTTPRSSRLGRVANVVQHNINALTNPHLRASNLSDNPTSFERPSQIAREWLNRPQQILGLDTVQRGMQVGRNVAPMVGATVDALKQQYVTDPIKQTIRTAQNVITNPVQALSAPVGQTIWNSLPPGTQEALPQIYNAVEPVISDIFDPNNLTQYLQTPYGVGQMALQTVAPVAWATLPPGITELFPAQTQVGFGVQPWQPQAGFGVQPWQPPALNEYGRAQPSAPSNASSGTINDAALQDAVNAWYDDNMYLTNEDAAYLQGGWGGGWGGWGGYGGGYGGYGGYSGYGDSSGWWYPDMARGV